MAASFTWPVAIWGALGAAALVRAFWNPSRAVTADGQPLSCPGAGSTGAACDAAITLGPASALYAVTPGRVYQAAPGVLAIASSIEPVLVSYTGAGVRPATSTGQDVHTGQPLGSSSGPFSFAVQQVQRGGKLVALEPSSWLAARGIKLSTSGAPSPLWCAQGRKILVPRSVSACGFRLPDPASVLLLPVTTTTE